MYDPNNLSALAYANGFTQWHYKTTDQAINVAAPGYFDDAHNMLRVGDFIMTNCFTQAGALAVSGHFTVVTNKGGHVTVGAMGAWFASPSEWRAA